MSFTSSLNKFCFLSELYACDAADAVLLAEYPSSNSEETIYQNKNRFIIHDPYPAPDRSLLKVLGPHHLMCCWGNKISVTSEVALPSVLVDHWNRIFGVEGCPDWHSFENKMSCITLFPFESLSAEQQQIDPETLYALHSKTAIEKIRCPQAAVLDTADIPCIMKLSHGYAGVGNYFIHNENDLARAAKQINGNWPESTIVINELITDIVGDYCVQFYLDRQGEVTWIGYTEQLFNENRWAGGTFSVKEQDRLYPELIKFTGPVSTYLHQNGYFGIVGIDILRNKRDDFFLVDLNPRLNGTTPFLAASRLFLKQGYSEGVYTPSACFSGRLEDIISSVENLTEAKGLILSAYEDPHTDQTLCHLSISAESIDRCNDILCSLQSRNDFK